MKLSEILPIFSSTTIIIGILFRQLNRIKKGIVYQIDRIDKLEKKPLKDVLERVENVEEKVTNSG